MILGHAVAAGIGYALIELHLMVPTHRRLLPVPCGAAEILLHAETVRVHHADSEVGDFISAGNGTVVPSKGGIDIGLSACPSLITPARKRLGPRVVLLGGDQKSAERALGITHTAGSAQIKLSQTTLCIRMPGFGGRRIPQHRAAAIDIQRRLPTITFAEIELCFDDTSFSAFQQLVRRHAFGIACLKRRRTRRPKYCGRGARGW